MTETDIASYRRRREGGEDMLTMIDDAVRIAVDRLDVDPDAVRDRVERMLAWLEGDESVEPGERPAYPTHTSALQ